MTVSSSAEPLVGIFTPVYNGESYLAECIESVLRQTYRNWQYVIVNNASSDGSLALANRYASQDSRIRVCSNEQLLPVARNFNTAIRKVADDSVYIKPLMADDWLMPDCIEKMVQAIERDSSIGLVCTMGFDGRHVMWDGWPYPAECVPGRDVVRRHLLDDSFYILGSPTSALIRSDLVKKRVEFYNEVNIAACDYESCLDVLRECNFAFVHQVLAFIRLHEKSVTQSLQSYEGGVMGRMYAFTRWGREYLSEAEFRIRREQLLDRYYRILAGHALERRDSRFWQFQSEWLKRMELELDRMRLWRAVGKRIIRDCLDPVSTFYRFTDGMRKSAST